MLPVRFTLGSRKTVAWEGGREAVLTTRPDPLTPTTPALSWPSERPKGGLDGTLTAVSVVKHGTHTALMAIRAALRRLKAP